MVFCNYVSDSVFQYCQTSQCCGIGVCAELRELRGAIQMDLERYPSSLPASVSVSSSLHLKELKNRFRLVCFTVTTPRKALFLREQ